MPQSMGLQRVGYNWAIELNWTSVTSASESWQSHASCYGLIQCPSHSYVEDLTSNMMVFGGGTFGRSSNLDEVMRMGPSWWDLFSYKEILERFLSLSPCCVRTQQEGSFLQARKRAPTGPCWLLDLRLTDSRVVRNKLLLFKLLTLGILLWIWS